MSVFVIDPLSLEASLAVSLWSRYARQLTSSAATVIGENVGRGGHVTIQEPSRGGDPEANLTEENSGIPGGTFRYASRLVRLITPRHRLSVNIFLHIKKSCQLLSFFLCSSSGGSISSSSSSITSVAGMWICVYDLTMKTPFLVS